MSETKEQQAERLGLSVKDLEEQAALSRRLIAEVVEEERVFLVNCRTYFGLLPRQSAASFKAEVFYLTVEDQEELAPLLEAALSDEVREQWGTSR